MTNSFIAINGNQFDRAEEIFSIFKYNDTKQDKQFNDWQTFNDYLTIISSLQITKLR